MVICEFHKAHLACGGDADPSANARLQGLQEEVLDDSDTNCKQDCRPLMDTNEQIRLRYAVSSSLISSVP